MYALVRIEGKRAVVIEVHNTLGGALQHYRDAVEISHRMLKNPSKFDVREVQTIRMFTKSLVQE